MRIRRPLRAVVGLVLVGGCLFALPGCGAQAERSLDDSSVQFSEGGETAPGAEPDLAGSTPDVPPQSPDGLGTSPDLPPVAVRMQPGPAHLDGEPARPDLVPTLPDSIPAGSGSEATDVAPAPPSFEPMLVAPRNVLRQPQPIAAEPRAMTIAARRDADVPAMDTDESRLPAEPASSEVASEASPAAESEEADYEVVNVFYGTDRKAVEASEAKGRAYIGWFYWSAASAAITVILFVAAYRFARRLPIFVLAGIGVAATVLLGIATTVARVQGEAPGTQPERAYGNERGELEMGTCEVSIPKRHEVGEIERPSVFRFEFEEDPRRHVVLLDVEAQSADTFFADLRARVEASHKKEAFVFVHGFNVTFEAAAQRTAQLAYDLKFEGAPIFFSWPSQGGLLQYSVDETNVVWAVPHLKEFLTGVARRSGAQAVHLIAHSMGNRALTSALQLLSYELKDEPPMFREVVLTAPDIDAEVFRRDIAPAIVSTADRVTLYASSNDEALKLSKTIHGYRRAGDSGDQLLIIPGVDTIDVSTVDTSLLGHDYYGSNCTVIADMLDLVNESKPPQLRRWLEPMQLGEMIYWVFHGDQTTFGASQPSGPPVRL